LIETEIGDEISLYDPIRERVTVLNLTASDLWRLADGEHSLSEVVDLLARAYGVEASEIRDEVAATVARLQAEGLLEVVA
jgi:hypothetical protein